MILYFQNGNDKYYLISAVEPAAIPMTAAIPVEVFHIGKSGIQVHQ